MFTNNTVQIYYQIGLHEHAFVNKLILKMHIKTENSRMYLKYPLINNVNK